MDSQRGPLFAICYAIAAAVAVQLNLPPLIAVLCVAPLVLIAPGASLVMALGVKQDPEFPWRRIVLSIALSIATTALGGLVVNAFAPLTAGSWSVWLVGFTCYCSSLALLKRPRHASPSLRLPMTDWYPNGAPDTPRWQSVSAGGLAILLLVGTAALTEVESHSAYDTPITQLSLLPLPGSHGRTVALTVSNLSGHADTLKLTVRHGPGRITKMALDLPASRTWTSTESVGRLGLRAYLTRPPRLKPISEVTWAGSSQKPPLVTSRAPR
jgi:hypothetical protein